MVILPGHEETPGLFFVKGVGVHKIRVSWAVPLCLGLALGCSQTTRDRLARFFFEIPEGSQPQETQDTAAPASDEPSIATLPETKYVSLHPTILPPIKHPGK